MAKAAKWSPHFSKKYKFGRTHCGANRAAFLAFSWAKAEGYLVLSQGPPGLEAEVLFGQHDGVAQGFQAFGFDLQDTDLFEKWQCVDMDPRLISC